MSAPPLFAVTKSIAALVDDRETRNEQSKAEGFMMDILRSEIEDLKFRLARQAESAEMVNFDLQVKQSELEVWRERSPNQDTTISQLREAMKENEEFFEGLQVAHDTLAERCTSLEEKNAALLNRKEEHQGQLTALKEENDRLKIESQRSHIRSENLKKEKKQMEGVVFELRRELKWAEKEIEGRDSVLLERDRKIEELEEAIQEKNRSYAEVSTEVDALKKELQIAHNDMTEKTQTITQIREITEQTFGSEIALRGYQDQLKEKDLEIGRLQNDFSECEDKVEDQRNIAREAEMNLHEQEFVLASLREQLNSSQQTTESLNLFLAEKNDKIDSLLLELSETKDLCKAAKREVVEVQQEVSELKEKLELSRFEKNERRFQAEVDINQLHEQLGETTRSAAEREWAGRQSTEMIARLMEEKRGWEEEKEELIEMINRNSVDDDSVCNLKARINTLENQLSSMSHLVDTLKKEMEDRDSSMDLKNTLIRTQEAELAALRVSIDQFEERWTDAKLSFDRQMKDSERVNGRLREQIDDLEIKLTAREEALKRSVIRMECEKQSDTDFQSRLIRFITVIDDLKLSETKLKNQVDLLRQSSAEETLKNETLQKRLRGLEEDKELLNVALESKEMELTLLQRNNIHSHNQKKFPSTPSTSSTVRANYLTSTGTSTVRSSGSNANPTSMSKSTSRIPYTPTPSTGDHSFTLPRRLTTSTSASTSSSTACSASTAAAKSRLRRDTISNLSHSQSHAATPIARTRAPLGESTIHNKQPSTSTTGVAKSGLDGKKVERRTNLPVLVRRPSSVASVASGSSLSRRESLSSVDEV
ncbi:uncharacterized protein I303_102902 [Kwoniella dejecticola CBS 10117]|uniref:Uncharacterized protein n=1 Tax=Kwoniella dejecticola CBS 10117 TaxID=1296121 RepID=A0A1A6AA21_9TREE|nr:uncharacterized protein I303_02922 [Kwoniella dejecticola CBS 10117]OBR86901.1 hypothetical protein I303_02922 [Kwoniella dejecticola CBS 10117]